MQENVKFFTPRNRDPYILISPHGIVKILLGWCLYISYPLCHHLPSGVEGHGHVDIYKRKYTISINRKDDNVCGVIINNFIADNGNK